MFFFRATRLMRASTVISTLRTSTGTGFSTPSCLQARQVEEVRYQVREPLGLHLELRGEEAGLDGVFIYGLLQALREEPELVAGVLSSWETFATKSRRILLTRRISSGLT